MHQEKISSYQFSMILAGFLSGSSISYNDIELAWQDSWISFLIGWGAGFALLGITLVIGRLHPNKTLVGIFMDCFGKIAGKAFSLFFIIYFIILAAIISKDFGYYSQTTNYPETPILFFLICIIFVCAFCVRIGIEVLARTSEIFICIALLNLVISVALLIPLLNVDVFKPFLSAGLTPVLQSGYRIAMVPFSEVFLYLMIFPSLNNSKSLMRSSFIAFWVGGASCFLFSAEILWFWGQNWLPGSFILPSWSLNYPHSHFRWNHCWMSITR
jgi:spore germination protein KB